MTQVERLRVAELVMDAQVLPDHGAHDYNQKRDEKQIHAKSLTFGISATDKRADEQARGEPRGGDPKQGELKVPRPRQAVRKPTRERNSIESVALDTVMGR